MSSSSSHRRQTGSSWAACGWGRTPPPTAGRSDSDAHAARQGRGRVQPGLLDVEGHRDPRRPEPVLAALEQAHAEGVGLRRIVDVDVEVAVDHVQQGHGSREVTGLGDLSDDDHRDEVLLADLRQLLEHAHGRLRVRRETVLAVVHRLQRIDDHVHPPLGVDVLDAFVGLLGLGDQVHDPLAQGHLDSVAGLAGRSIDEHARADGEVAAQLQSFGAHLDLGQRLLAGVVEHVVPLARQAVGQLQGERGLARPGGTGVQVRGTRHEPRGVRGVTAQNYVEERQARRVAHAQPRVDLDRLELDVQVDVVEVEVHIRHVWSPSVGVVGVVWVVEVVEVVGVVGVVGVVSSCVTILPRSPRIYTVHVPYSVKV